MRNDGSAPPGRTVGDQALANWLLFGGQPANPEPPHPNGRGAKITAVPAVTRPPKDRAGTWLRFAGIALALLAIAAAVVSFQAQYSLVITYKKHQHVVSLVQAGIPDIGALVFACLGIALALHGRRALRARALNVGCVGISIGMNALAAAEGWSATAIWVMAPSVYAVASDTLIGVIRAYAIARQRSLNEALADDGTTPLQVVGAFLLWLLRLFLAPPSTLRGFRAWVLSTPVSPRPREIAPPEIAPRVIPPRKLRAIAPPKAGTGRRHSKTARFLELVIEKYGPLSAFDLSQASRVASEIAPQVDLDDRSAYTALRKAVLAARNGNSS